MPLKEQTDCAEDQLDGPGNDVGLEEIGLGGGEEIGGQESSAAASGERTRSIPRSQALAQEDGDSSVYQKERPTSQSERVAGSACTACGYNGIIADHLRLSKKCVESLRREPQLRMKASEVVFIVKASLMLTAADPMQCPAKECPGGPHCALPPSCLLWWKETGWTLMGWSGSSTRATSEIVHHKISQFHRNLRLFSRVRWRSCM